MQRGKGQSLTPLPRKGPSMAWRWCWGGGVRPKNSLPLGRRFGLLVPVNYVVTKPLRFGWGRRGAGAGLGARGFRRLVAVVAQAFSS